MSVIVITQAMFHADAAGWLAKSRAQKSDLTITDESGVPRMRCAYTEPLRKCTSCGQYVEDDGDEAAEDHHDW